MPLCRKLSRRNRDAPFAEAGANVPLGKKRTTLSIPRWACAAAGMARSGSGPRGEKLGPYPVRVQCDATTQIASSVPSDSAERRISIGPTRLRSRKKRLPGIRIAARHLQQRRGFASGAWASGGSREGSFWGFSPAPREEAMHADLGSWFLIILLSITSIFSENWPASRRWMAKEKKDGTNGALSVPGGQ